MGRHLCAGGLSLLVAFSPVYDSFCFFSSICFDGGSVGFCVHPAVALSHISHIHTYHLSSLCGPAGAQGWDGMGWIPTCVAALVCDERRALVSHASWYPRDATRHESGEVF